MPYIEEKEIIAARQVDLLSYLKSNAPCELVQLGRDVYCTREHDSLKISNGKWYWFSRGIGGCSALDYLVHVKNYSFPQAVKVVLQEGTECMEVSNAGFEKRVRTLLLPEKSDSYKEITRYLCSRGIHTAILDYCYKNDLIYEGIPYHNAVFVGYDEDRVARYAAIRATHGRYKGEASGSDKQYAFNIPAEKESAVLHIFESAIDLLSFATIEYMEGGEWRENHLLSLAGVFRTKREEILPVAMQRFFRNHPEIQTVCLHLDNDPTGRRAAETIAAALEDKYKVIDILPEHGKDMNDELRFRFGSLIGWELSEDD